MSIEKTIEQRLLGSIRRHLICFGIVAAVLVGGIGLWAAFTNIVGAVIATGVVVVESNTKQVQHQEGGIIKAIEVKDGDLVRAGAVLVRLDDTIVRANWKNVVAQLGELYAQKARLLAEQKGANAVVFPKKVVSSWLAASIKVAQDNQRRLFKARRDSLAGQKLQLQEQIAQLNQKIAGFQAESRSKNKEMQLVKRDLVDLKPLFKKKFIAKTQINELKRDHIQLQGAYNSLIASIAQAKQEISELKLQSLQLDEDTRIEQLQQLQTTRMDIARLENEKVTAEDQLQRLTIRAPRSGYVHSLAVHTVGGVITPSETLMLLVPEEDVLLVEARMRPTDIDQLFLGQHARIRLPSFDQRTTPELEATLETLSADLLQDQATGEQYYQGRFTIAASELEKLNGKLIPGMPVEVFAKTQERTVLSYWLKPLRDQIAHALKER